MAVDPTIQIVTKMTALTIVKDETVVNLQIAAPPSVRLLKTVEQGLPGARGADGQTPTTEQLTAIILPLIPGSGNAIYDGGNFVFFIAFMLLPFLVKILDLLTGDFYGGHI